MNILRDTFIVAVKQCYLKSNLSFFESDASLIVSPGSALYV